MIRRLLCTLVLSTVAVHASHAAPPAATVAPALPAALAAAQPVTLLDGATPPRFFDDINPKDAPGSFTATGNAGGVPVYRAVNPKPAANYYGIRAEWRTGGAIRKGDLVYARITLRAIKARQESGEIEGIMFFRSPSMPEQVVQTFSVGPDWTTVGLSFVAGADIAPGDGSFGITYGHLEQTFDVTGIEILNFGDRLKPGELPANRFTYAGREADAPWRREALARIEKLRTAPLRIVVRDSGGRPVPGAAVKAEQTRSEFLWGSAVRAASITGAGPDDARYREVVREHFDTVVIENDLKWASWYNPSSRPRTLQAIGWLREQGIRVKGHALVWPAWKFSPKPVADSPAQRERIGELVENHIDDIMRATQGKLIGWDVINEPVHEKDYFKHVPEERIAHWYKMAAAREPGLQLTMNEYAMLNRSTSPLFIKEFKAFAERMRGLGARIDVLGVQGHVGQTPRAPAAVLSDLDLLAEGGNKVQITEFDMNTPDEELQGDYTRDFLIAVYSHPAVTGMLNWGFWQKAHWKPNAAMYRADWSEKPNARAWKELVRGAWKTRVDGRTGADGALETRAHRGQYQVSVSAGGRTLTRTADVGAEGVTVEIKLPQ